MKQIIKQNPELIIYAIILTFCKIVQADVIFNKNVSYIKLFIGLYMSDFVSCFVIAYIAITIYIHKTKK